jgi:benzoylformate decarboxylase
VTSETARPATDGHPDGAAARTVRDATFDVLRERGLTTIFSNPGSTEVPFLAGLPDDLRFVLGLHEGAVVGMATGLAIGSGAAAFALLHTTAGLGNAVAALATARVNRAPVVVVVGQQDRRHLALEPFLTGRLEGLAGDYPVWVNHPPRAQDVPGAIARAHHEAVTGRGPAIVIVPMDDWLAPAGEGGDFPAADRVLRPSAADPAAIEELAALLADAADPALVVGAGADSAETWAALVEIAERLGAPVWQEAFGARAGFPGDHRLFAGQLPADRARLRRLLARHDVVVAVGAPVFRQYPFMPGTLVEPGTRVAVVTDEPAEAHRSPADLAVIAPPAAVARGVAEILASRGETRDDGAPARPLRETPAAPAPPGPGEPLRAGHVFAALAERLPRDAIVVEESPSSRPELEARLPARAPLGFLSAAMGGLGFAVPGAAGVRMGLPERPVVALVGDGAAIYQIQAVWSAARYSVGVLFVVLSNGRYAIMDRLAERTEQSAPWPAFEDIRLATVATGFGCPARRIADHAELVAVLDEVVPGLADRDEPLLLDVAVEADPTFAN